MDIVPLAPEHVEGCVDVISSLPEWFGYEGAIPAIRTALGEQAGFVGVEDGEVRGFVTLMSLFDESAEITYLAVHKDHRRNGLGRQLVAMARDWAEENDASSIALLTLGPSANSEHYLQTVEFYRSVGFWRIKELALTAWGGATALLMEAPLSRLG